MAHAKKRSPKRTQRTASSRSPKPSKPTAPIAVSVPVDRALKSAWEKQSKIIAQASRDDARALDAKYEAVALIAEHNPPLYLAGGYATFDAFVKDHLHEEVRQVRDWMQVATHASPEEETLFSFTRLALLLSLLRAKSKDGTLPKSIDWKSLKVTVQPAKGKPVLKKAIDCTMDEIRAARRAAIDAKTGSPTTENQPK